MSKTLQLRLLGRLEIHQNGVPVTEIQAGKTLALLSYLAVTARPHTRPALAGLLWGGMPEAKARGNLSKALSTLRRNVGDYLTITRQTAAFEPDGEFWLDVAEFEAGVRDNSIERLQKVVQLYEGEFLDGFSVRNAPEFEDWVLAQGVRLKELTLRALHTLAAHFVDQDEAGRAKALDYTKQLLRLEPWREEAHRQMMRLLALNGQRGAALAQYETCRQLLADELGAEPGAETMALYHTLQRQDMVVDLPTSARFTTKVDYRLVGRPEEWATLRRCWQTLTRPHFVCISGEAGIGKTRLAEELLMLAERGGERAARARYHALKGRLAYGPVADWLRTVTFRPSLARLDRVWLTELARLLPELLIQYLTLEPPQPMHDAWQRKRLFDALTQAFTQERGPLLLLLDDLQWCDTDTLEWLQYLLERATISLLLVGTVRSDELTADHPLHGLRLRLQRSEQFTELALISLTARATSSLANQVVEQALTGERAAHLYQDTAGNPLFIIESIRMAVAEVGASAEQGKTPADANRFPGTIPPKVYSVIQARLTQLSTAALNLAQLGATVGRAFEVSLLAQAAGQPEEVILDGLDELWQRRIIRKVDAMHYDFSHDRIRDVAYAEISPLIQIKCHRQVAQALESINVDALRQVSGELATHYERGGQHQQALTYYLLAVEVAKALYAHVDVVEQLQKAIAILQLLPPNKELRELEIDLWFRLGLAEIVVTYFGSARVAAAWEKAYELATQTANPFLRGQTLLGMAIYRKNRGRWLESFDYSKLAVSLAVEINDPYLKSHIFVEHGGVLYHVGRPAEAVTYFDKVFELEHDAVTPSFEWFNRYPNRNALLRSAKALWILGYADQARNQCRKALDMLEGDIDLELYWQEQFPTLDFAAMLYAFLRDIETVETLGTRLLELSKEYQYLFYKRAGRMFMGWVTAYRGDPETGSRMVRDSVYGHHEQGNHMFEPHWRALLAETLMLAERIDEALEEVNFALANLDESGNNFWTAHLLTLKGNCLLAQSTSVTEVERCYQQAINIAHEQRAKSLELRATTSLCRLWQRQDRQDEARQRLSVIYGWFTEGFDTLDLIEAKALLGELAIERSVKDP